MGRSPVEALERALAATLAAQTARVRVVRQFVIEWPRIPARRRGGLLRPVLRVGKAAGKQAWKRFTALNDPRHMEGEGVVDIGGRRCAVDLGHYAELFADGGMWSGRSGRLLATLPKEALRAPGSSPLWLVDILSGVTNAVERETEMLGSSVCRHVSAEIDLSRASAGLADGVATPALPRFEELFALPVDVWFDECGIRRIRFQSDITTNTVELYDFGVLIDGLDWSRLPTFRSPEEAEMAARGQDHRGSTHRSID